MTEGRDLGTVRDLRMERHDLHGLAGGHRGGRACPLPRGAPPTRATVGMRPLVPPPAPLTWLARREVAANRGPWETWLRRRGAAVTPPSGVMAAADGRGGAGQGVGHNPAREDCCAWHFAPSHYDTTRPL